MEDRIWRIVRSLVPVGKPASGRFRYRTGEILLVVLWAVLHDRPMNWACCPENWPDRWRPKQLPHPSTISRRWRCEGVQAQARQIHERAVSLLTAGRYAAIDGRALLVGGFSKDPEARWGRAAGGMGKGYKLHAVVDAQGVIVSYRITPLSVAEPKVAAGLLKVMSAHLTRVVGDAWYDSMNLHRIAAQTGRRFYAPLRENRVGRRQQPRRLHLWRLWQRPVGQRLLAWRDEIERVFGHESTVGFGFKGLPAWARRHHRVERWMWGKTLCYHAWLIHKGRAA